MNKVSKSVVDKEWIDQPGKTVSTLHRCRGSFGLWAFEEGYPLSSIDLVLGHKLSETSATGRRYIRVSRSDRVIENLRPVLDAWANFLLPDGIQPARHTNAPSFDRFKRRA